MPHKRTFDEVDEQQRNAAQDPPSHQGTCKPRQINYNDVLRALQAQAGHLPKLFRMVAHQQQCLEVEEQILLQMIDRERSHLASIRGAPRLTSATAPRNRQRVVHTAAVVASTRHIAAAAGDGVPSGDADVWRADVDMAFAGGRTTPPVQRNMLETSHSQPGGSNVPAAHQAGSEAGGADGVEHIVCDVEHVPESSMAVVEAETF